MFFRSLVAAAALVGSATACAGHDNHYSLSKRADPSPQTDWAYETSFNWARINPSMSQMKLIITTDGTTHCLLTTHAHLPDYTLCQTGTQQSPIALNLNQGLSLNHIIDFNYNGNITGNFHNWQYGPAFTVVNEDKNWANNPSITYDNETVYLKGWHIHTPADHTVGGDRSKAELHFVHVDANGKERAVLAFRLDPGNADNAFFSQIPKMIGWEETNVQREMGIDHTLALQSVLYFNEFWTYEGSLTSPPCTEGIRWFVARQIMFVGVDQMRAILRASTYSARVEQEVWQHRINQ